MDFSSYINSKRYFLFDLDGTLVDLENLNFTSFLNTIDHFFNKELTYEEYLQYFAGSGSLLGFKEYCKAKDITVSDISIVQGFYRRIKLDKLNNDFENVIKLIPSADRYLKQLNESGKKVALGTSSAKRYADIIIKKLEIERYFDAVVTVDDVKNTKPDPEIFLRALELVSGNKQDSIIFEDSPRGIQSAENSGIDFVVIKGKNNEGEELEKFKYVINNYGQLLN